MLLKQRGIHAVSFGWDDFRPVLLGYDVASASLEEVDLSRMAMAVGEGRKCVGSFREGNYRPCPFERQVEFSEQCEFCSRSIIPIQRCLYDPICDGHICMWNLCMREHTVYMAFYSTTVKVGMTSSSRIRQRIIEQGADAYFEVAKLANRKEARALEKKLSAELKLSQAIRMTELLELLSRGAEREKMEEEYERIARVLDERYSLRPSQLHYMDGYPLEIPVKERVLETPVEGIHKGEVVGLKGRLAIYRDGRLMALNMNQVVGRTISMVE